MKRIISVIIVFLIFLLTIFPSAITRDELKEFNILYVDDDNTNGPWDGSVNNPYKNIQDAIDNATDGDTVYVFNGTYEEHIRVDIPIILKGQDKFSTVINGSYNEIVVKIYSDSVFLSNFTLCSGYMPGVFINSNNVNLNDNIFIDNYIGIELYYAENCSIQNNIVSDNFLTGVFLHNSKNNYLKNNSITVNGIDLVSYEQVPAIILLTSYNNTFLNNNISNNADGILLQESHRNMLSSNIISENRKNGINLDNSTENRLENNTISNNGNSGLKVEYSHNSTVLYNTIFNNENEGIWLFHSYYNTFHHNIVSSNSRGFELGGYKNNLYKNSFTNNSEYGIHFWATCANEIVNNNFINNEVDASFSHVYLMGYSKVSDLFLINNNHLNQNYWHEKKILPKFISGSIRFYIKDPALHLFTIPCFECDWNPSEEPNEI